ncbi:hypothetical protein [Arenibacter certesii]|uniref:Uncharacterized protein n=1 Tax=Arenibacter certesii TaxID=228955 RepID=A0A918IWM8_9FLAO|nr:hypothetical protein [Arenibacter certesii]GGW36385.1 hypothetical protein GCM10007383_21670 [Arenibacter certesii]
MRKITIIAVTIILAMANKVNAQVGIGTPTPSNATLLDVVAIDKGVLIPRVSLSNTTVYAPIVGDEEESILVYNTTQSADLEAINSVSPGFYYWQNNQWQRIVSREELDKAIANLGNTFNTTLGSINNLINYIAPSNPNNIDENGNPIITEDHSTVVWDGKSFSVVTYDNVAEEYVKTLVDLGTLISGFETNTFIRVEDNGVLPSTYHYFSEIAIKNWLSNPANNGLDPMVDMPVNEPGVLAINVVGDVVANFEYILDQTITYKGKQLTIEKVIQSISSQVDGNVIYTEVGGEMVFQYYNASTEQYETISLGEFVQNFETKTFIKKIDAIIENDGTVTSPTIYYYFSEEAIKIWLDLDPANTIANIPNDADGVVAINVANDVAFNFEHILNQTITYEGEQITIEQIIQNISSEIDGNVIYTDVGGEMVFQYYDGSGYITINLDQVVQDLESNTFIKKVDATYYYFSEEAIKTWLALNPGGDLDAMEVTAPGVVAISVIGDVVENFEYILNQETNYGGTNYTVEEIIQMISTEVSGNVIYTEINSGEWVFQHFVEGSGYVTINLEELVKASETQTSIARAVINTNGETPSYVNSTVETTPTEAGQILYKYEAEGGNINYLNLTEDMLHSIENNVSIKNAITDILNAGGNVLFGDVTIDSNNYTGVLHYYDVNGDPQLIDVSKTLIQNLIDNSTQVQELKNVLGNKYVENTLIYTGDSIDGKKVAAYKTTTTIGAHTAITSGVTLPQAPSGVVSISLFQGGNLVTKSTTDHTISSNNVNFNIGLGNHYQVLSEGLYEVIITFTVTP